MHDVLHRDARSKHVWLRRHRLRPAAARVQTLRAAPQPTRTGVQPMGEPKGVRSTCPVARAAPAAGVTASSAGVWSFDAVAAVRPTLPLRRLPRLRKMPPSAEITTPAPTPTPKTSARCGVIATAALPRRRAADAGCCSAGSGHVVAALARGAARLSTQLEEGWAAASIVLLWTVSVPGMRTGEGARREQGRLTAGFVFKQMDPNQI